MTSAGDTSTGPRPRVLILWNQAPEEAEVDAETAEESEDAEEAEGLPEARAPLDPAGPSAEHDVPPAVRAVLEVLRARGFDAAHVNAEDDIDRIAAAVVIERPALIFNLVDEFYGDGALLGALAAYLELLDVPFVGAEPACLLACQDRVHVRLVLRDAGVPVPRFQTVRDVEQVPAIDDLRPPLIVTQALDDLYHDEGLERPLHDRSQAAERVAALAREYEPPFLIEEYLPQRRLHALVLGHGPLDVLPLLEAAGASELARQAAGPGEAEPEERAWVLAALDAEASARIAELARRAYRALGCRDAACIDIHLDADSRPHVVDVRPVVEFDTGGPLHVAAERTALGFAGVVVELVERAAQR